MQENECSHSEPSSNHYHLEYLDQFLQLKCAPDMIAMGLFPNSKEITETFAVWTAIRKHILPRLSISSVSNRPNAIIVVGDGMTPRTAALCAYLTKGAWQCFSIDPMLQYDTYADMTCIHRRSITTAEHCQQWKSIKGLRMVRAKVQTVSIQCRQAIVAMMHAHVTLEDVRAAVDASEGIVGVVTCPCCKWAPFQEEWLGQVAHQKYTDSRLLSAKNQMNVWCFPDGDHCKTSNSTEILTERTVWGIETSIVENVLSNRDGVKQRAFELWPQIFSDGIRAFNTTEVHRSSNDLEIWPWASTAWSPRDIVSLMKSYSVTTASPSAGAQILPSWFKKPVLLVGIIGGVRHCKQSIFYELNTCPIPSKHLEDILRLTSFTSSTQSTTDDTFDTTAGTFPALLRCADRIWTCVEYQRHRQAVVAFDSTAARNTSKRNSKTRKTDDTAPLAHADRVNVLLSLSSHKNNTTSTDERTTSVSAQSKDHAKAKLFEENPQPRQSLFPWAMSLRSGDILVAYCQIGRNGSQGPVLCLIDGVLLFDSKLHICGVDRRTLR